MTRIGILSAMFVLPWVLGFAAREEFDTKWEFVERGGTLWLMRTEAPPEPGISQTELCPDLPKIEYVFSSAVTDAQTSSSEVANDDVLAQLFELGKWSVRPLHIWGVYSEIGCKEPLGWGTAFLIGLYKRTYIWATVEHNVKTDKYFESIFGREIATNWFVQDASGNFKELLPIGCKEDKFCLLQSSYVNGTSVISLDDDYISNDVRLLEKTYVYGCSVVSERVKKYVQYRLHHFCLGNDGYVNSGNSIRTRDGGDFLISNPAMPGFSGAPVLAYRDGRFSLLGTVNSGVPGVFTAVNGLDENTIVLVKEWLKNGESLFEQEKE